MVLAVQKWWMPSQVSQYFGALLCRGLHLVSNVDLKATKKRGAVRSTLKSAGLWDLMGGWE